VLDEGNMTDSQGRKISFKNTIIIMTSNVGAKRIMEPKNLGFMAKTDEAFDYEKMKEGVMEEVRNLFKPEFLNRIDELIVFHALTKEEIKQIVDLLIHNLTVRMETQLGIKLEVSDEVKENIAIKGYDKSFGARPLRRAVQTRLEDPLADRLLSGELSAGDTAQAELDGEEIVIRTKAGRKQGKSKKTAINFA
jgi:ATP-dependent Clp protease ATP-binding subunit ClpC